MDVTAKLLDALQANDDGAALEILDAYPEAARGKGPNGESPVLMALYRGKSRLAARIAGGAEFDVCEAAALGDQGRLGELLDQGASTGTRSFDGWTPLHLAAFFGQPEAARLLITQGAEVDALSTNSTANTPLCAALAGTGNADIVVLLLDAGADVNARASHGVTPLHLAASRGVDSLIRTLITRGANAAARMDDGTTPAAMATARGHEQAAALLVPV